MALRRRLPEALLRTRYPLLALWTLAWSVGLARTWSPREWLFNDWVVFQFAGRILLGQGNYDPGPGGALHMYANLPRVQIGPPALLVSIPVDQLPGVSGVYAAVALMAAMGLALVLVAERLGRDLNPGADLRGVVLLGGLAFVPAWACLAAMYMHLDDALVLLLLAGAMLATARDRWVWVAVLLGIAVATKPWALFLLPVIWGLSRERRAHAVLLVLVVAAVFWAPFVIAAPDTVASLGGLRMPVAPDSGLRALGVDAAVAPHWLRAVQIPLAAAVGLAVAARGRWTAAALAAIAVRCALDAATFPYYFAGLAAAALLWDVASARRFPTATVAAVAIGFAPILLRESAGDAAAAVLRLLGCLGLIAAAYGVRVPVVAERRRDGGGSARVRGWWPSQASTP